MTLALIAGTGGLPPLLAERLVAAGDVPVVCEMEGYVSDVDPDLPRMGFRIEVLGSFLATLQEVGVTGVCMAGAMRRPDIDPTAIDDRTAPLVPRLTAALAKGDDGTLREFIALFEEHGMEVLGAHEVAPDLLLAEGSHAKSRQIPLSPVLEVAGWVLAEMASEDMGQAMVVLDGGLIAREDTRGTDAMLGDLAQGAAAGGVLVKAPKPGQDLRVDMPVIGLATAQRAAEIGLAGIVIQQDGVMVLDPEAVIAVLKSHDMFLEVRTGLSS